MTSTQDEQLRERMARRIAQQVVPYGPQSNWSREEWQRRRIAAKEAARIALASQPAPDTAGEVLAIIEWLRGTSHRAPLTIARQIADDIERGEYIADPALSGGAEGEGV